ncbi:MAG: ATP-dependent sacrificial sulfur transferase LarE [Candidatus Zixiibacteriota bacterium]|nr:MAG: ATP-dependent sacrificial sulfur transferase LarE [candidate division Zixibacteria bacterium]
MPRETKDKLARLRDILQDLDSALLAFSGGVDSSFLLKVAHDMLGEKVVAVTSDSETMARPELQLAQSMAKSIDCKHILIKTNEMCDPDFVANSPDRCFHCKKTLFGKLTELAREHNLKYVIEGSNIDDVSDYRPGFRAIEQYGVRSPLKEAGLTKDDIRVLSKSMGLSTWDKPAAPCLASRIPYGSEVTPEKLHRIEKSEEYLHSLGLRVVRVRDHGAVARIEAPPENLPMLIDPAKSAEISDSLKSFGYQYVAVDLKGFRSGSLNEPLKDEQDG